MFLNLLVFGHATQKLILNNRLKRSLKLFRNKRCILLFLMYNSTTQGTTVSGGSGGGGGGHTVNVSFFS